MDFCHKYRFNFLVPASLSNFLNKLKEKKQTETQQKQANHSIRLFYELVYQQTDIKNSLAQIMKTPKNKGGDLNSAIQPVNHIPAQESSSYSINQKTKKLKLISVGK